LTAGVIDAGSVSETVVLRVLLGVAVMSIDDRIYALAKLLMELHPFTIEVLEEEEE